MVPDPVFADIQSPGDIVSGQKGIPLDRHGSVSKRFPFGNRYDRHELPSLQLMWIRGYPQSWGSCWGQPPFRSNIGTAARFDPIMCQGLQRCPRLCFANDPEKKDPPE